VVHSECEQEPPPLELLVEVLELLVDEVLVDDVLLDEVLVDEVLDELEELPEPWVMQLLALLENSCWTT